MSSLETKQATNSSIIDADSRIAIVGAGIGGLTLALALAKLGVRNLRIYESKDHLSEVGAGLQVGPNASRLLARLGLGEALEENALRFSVGQMFEGVSGRKLTNMPLDDYSFKAYGAHNYQMSRTDLYRVLLEAVESAFETSPILLGKALVAISDFEHKPVIGFDDGSSDQVDIVIGADGVRSQVRSALFPSAQASYSGYYAWRGILSADALVAKDMLDGMSVWMGEEKHLIAYPLNRNSVNLAGVCRSDSWPENVHGVDADVSEWSMAYEDWHSRPKSLISALEECHKWPIYRLDSLHSWSKGAVGLLGDAAHPMMPTLAQGAAQAIEDAVVLASLIAEAVECRQGAAEILARYFSRRMARVERVTQASEWNLRYFHRRRSLWSMFQNAGMRLGGAATTGIIARRYKWLYRDGAV